MYIKIIDINNTLIFIIYPNSTKHYFGYAECGIRNSNYIYSTPHLRTSAYKIIFKNIAKNIRVKVYIFIAMTQRQYYTNNQ